MADSPVEQAPEPSAEPEGAAPGDRMGGTPRPSLWPLLVVVAVGSWAAWRWLAPAPASGTGSGGPAPAAGAPAAPALECPGDQLPDDGVCIPVPPAAERVAETESTLELLPGRSADYGRYVTPIAAYPAAAPSDGLGLFVAAPRGVPVTAVSLEAQTGPTRRWVTAPTATSAARLLTVHHVDRGGSLRTYLLAYDGVAFDAAPGSVEVDVGTPLGRVAGGRGATGLALSVHQLRRGVKPEGAPPEQLLTDPSSLVCDARNVLPLKPAP